MKKMVAGILRQYGSAMTVTHGETSTKVRGFFQPVRSKSLQSIVHEESPLGLVSRRQYIFMGPGDLEMEEDAVLTLEEKQYLLRRVEKYRYGDQTVYTWALCVEKGEDDTWGS